jgi:hypothetical protein
MMMPSEIGVFKILSFSSFKKLLEFTGINTGISTVNKEMYIDILHHPRDAARWKHSENI